MRPYWETETPKVIMAGKQRFSYYKEAQVLDIALMVEEGDSKKPIRIQALYGDRLRNNKELSNMIVDFLEDTGVIRVEE